MPAGLRPSLAETLERIRKSRGISKEGFANFLRPPPRTKRTATQYYDEIITGRHRPPYSYIVGALEQLSLAREDRDDLESSYAFGQRLAAIIHEYGLSSKRVAEKAGHREEWLSRYTSGSVLPSSAREIDHLLQIIGVESPDREELEALSGLDFRAVGGEVDASTKAALERLLKEVQRGLGQSRLQVDFRPSEIRVLPGGKITGREAILRHVREFVTNIGLRSDDTPILVAFGRHLDRHEEQTILRTLRFALDEGHRILQLLPPPNTPPEAIYKIIDCLNLLGFEGLYQAKNVRYDTEIERSQVIHYPMRGIHSPSSWGVFFLPFEGRSSDAYAFTQTPEYFTDYFYSAFGAAHPKLRLYGAEADGHLELERTLLRIESDSKGRFLAKEGINSLMIPDSAWSWEAEYKCLKFGLDPSSRTRRVKEWLTEVRKLKRQRLANFTDLLVNYPCFDICCGARLKEFFIKDNPLMSDPSSTRAARRLSLGHLLELLERYNNYRLALTERDTLTDVFFEVAADAGVVLEVWQESGRSPHLELHSPLVQRAFRDYFLEMWERLPARFKDKQRVCEQLRSFQEQIR